MLRPDTGPIVLSATDLTNHLGCEHLTVERRRIALGLRSRPPVFDVAHADLRRRRGDEHEAAVLVMLSQTAAGDVADLRHDAAFTAEGLARGAADTDAAMRRGAALIFQATFFDGRWQGRTDFLRRIERPSALGSWAYEVLDTKLARGVKPYVVHQLCLYNRLLAATQGFEPRTAYVILGDGTEVPVDLGRYGALHRHTSRLLERVVDGEPEPVYPEPTAHCGICSLDLECRTRRRADDHLSLVAGATRDQRDRLVRAHVETVRALADEHGPTEIPGLHARAFGALHHQARLQVESRETEHPTRRQLPPERERGYARLPAPSPGDLFFDLEGDPYVGTDGGIEYLWGWTTTDGTYGCRWAHDEHGERAALTAFIELVAETRRAHPDMHVYHYAPHEKSKLRSLAQTYGVLETVVDEWLRADVLVDLYGVVRQALQVGEESYSLKQLERHHGFARLERSVREGGGSIVAYETWLETRDDTLLEAIRAYNEEDCASTASLRDWLRDEMLPEAAAEYEADFGDLAKPAPEAPYEQPGWLAGVLDLIDRLHEGLPELAEEDDARQAVRRLLGDLLLYHYRESKPQYWSYFDLRAKTAAELVHEREAVGLLTLDPAVPPLPVARSLHWTYRFPEQEIKLGAGNVQDPTTGATHTLVRVTDDHLVLRKGRDADPPAPQALIEGPPPDPAAMRKALVTVAEQLLAGDEAFPAAFALLRREPPRLRSGRLGSSVDDLISATLGLERSVLPVQGPPGTGKTYSGARMIVAALRAGKRVAVSAQSHAAIHNLLHAVELHAAEERVVFDGIYKPKAGDLYESPCGLIAEAKDSKATWTGEHQLVAGTSWLLASDQHRAAFDLLFIDEAGQFSLASAVSIAPCAASVVLLGDPQQLPQVNQASHPNGAGASVLEHLLGGHDVVEPGRGVLLGESWRMHPEVCAFISERSYERMLHAHPSCANRRVDAPGAISGAGLRTLAVEHDRRSQDSPEEAAAIARACRDLLRGGQVTGSDGETRMLRPQDIMIVAPYTMAVARIRRAVPDGVRVGTVDMFQGREAPVVFYALTCSTGEDVPRGLDFLFSRNRLNVAISRAQCLAVLVHAPRLLDADCRTLEQMALVDGACRFAELARPVGDA